MTKKYRPVLCLDFDGVIHSYKSGWQGARNTPDDPVPGAFEFMWSALNSGWDVVIHSSRARHFGGIRAMRKYIKKHAEGAWWETAGHRGLEDLRFVRWKPAALVTLDDRAVTFNGKWPSLNALRKFKPWNKP